VPRSCAASGTIASVTGRLQGETGFAQCGSDANYPLLMSMLELVWKRLKAGTIGRTSITSFDAILPLQRSPVKIRAFFQKPSLQYAA
jgi:hypothetical protein